MDSDIVKLSVVALVIAILAVPDSPKLQLNPKTELERRLRDGLVVQVTTQQAVLFV